MKRFCSPVWVVGAVLFLASCGESNELDSKQEPAAVKVENPCDCFGEGLTAGQSRYCRESKRDTRFLDALRTCSMGEVEGVSAVEKMPFDGEYTMDKDKTVVQWSGTKVGTIEEGTVTLRSCTFSIDHGILEKGEMVIEMNGIKATSQKGKAARELTEHLRSEDFFNVAQFPTASFVVSSTRADGMGSLLLSGALTIKGKTKEMDARIRFASTDPVIATLDFIFDRSDFDVRFGSGSFFEDLGDNLISDMVGIKMALIEDKEARRYK